ncbi:Hypoxic response protein 1 [bacterium HR37]|nr:Hypoxic response protein 1 [bacterium HR37]
MKGKRTMCAKEIMRTEVVTVSPLIPVTEAAILMRNEDVGSVVVVDEERRPIGIITDRDIVVSAVADRKNPEEMTVGELMLRKPISRELVTVDEDEDVFDILEVLARNSIRRVPVVRGEKLVGIVSVDDIVVVVATELSNLASVLGSTSKVF